VDVVRDAGRFPAEEKDITALEGMSFEPDAAARLEKDQPGS
jgi:hypothetical protein